MDLVLWSSIDKFGFISWCLFCTIVSSFHCSNVQFGGDPNSWKKEKSTENSKWVALLFLSILLSFFLCILLLLFHPMAENLHLRGVLKGHSGWVTCIGCSPESPDTIISGSRGWTFFFNLPLLRKKHRQEHHCVESYEREWTKLWCSSTLIDRVCAKLAVKVQSNFHSRHSHFIQDLTISSDGQFALSGSWDGTLRLWDLNFGTTTRRFVGHSKDVLSVAFSADNRQIVSGARDKTIKLWNTLGECKYTIEDQGHTEWVSCVRFSPNTQNPIIVSGGWDKLVKVTERIRFSEENQPVFLCRCGI